MFQSSRFSCGLQEVEAPPSYKLQFLSFVLTLICCSEELMMETFNLHVLVESMTLIDTGKINREHHAMTTLNYAQHLQNLNMILEQMAGDFI